MSSESEQESSLQEQISAIKEYLLSHLKYFLLEQSANDLYDSGQRSKRAFALYKIRHNPDSIKLMLSKVAALEKQPSLKILLDYWNGEEFVNIPISSIEAFEIASQMTPQDYALICEYAASEYIAYMNKKIEKLDEELENPEIPTEDEQSALSFKDVFESDVRRIEHYLDAIQNAQDTDWRKKIPIYHEIGREDVFYLTFPAR